MERICVRTSDWDGHISEAWDDWLADEEGELLISERRFVQHGAGHDG
jgi:hypothetical protein